MIKVRSIKKKLFKGEQSMNRLKKIISLILVVTVLASTSLTGCSKTNNNGTKTSHI